MPVCTEKKVGAHAGRKITESSGSDDFESVVGHSRVQSVTVATSPVLVVS